MKIALYLLIAIYIIYLATCSQASDPNQLQDFCVAVDDSKASVLVNGKICKDPKMVTADDFFFSGLNKPGNTSNPFGNRVTRVNVNTLQGLNTLGITLIRIDYAPYGLSPLTHPRAMEILVVVEGTLYVGFVTSTDAANTDQKNKLFTKILHPGDVFVFPQGLIHFLLNMENTNAVVYAGQSSQSPGVIRIANDIFGLDPPINSDVLAKAFRFDKNLIDYLQALPWNDNI